MQRTGGFATALYEFMTDTDIDIFCTWHSWSCCLSHQVMPCGRHEMIQETFLSASESFHTEHHNHKNTS